MDLLGKDPVNASSEQNREWISSSPSQLQQQQMLIDQHIRALQEENAKKSSSLPDNADIARLNASRAHLNSLLMNMNQTPQSGMIGGGGGFGGGVAPPQYWRRNNLTYDPAAHGVISKLAEERTRSTFSSIEAILDAVSSINTILESTYTAVYGSFRTITSVADHLIFVRNHLAEIALIPRVIQIVARFCRWLLHLVGLGNSKLAARLGQSGDEQIWKEALAKDFSPEDIKRILAQSDDSAGPSSPLWPIFLFFSLVLGTPYIIWRLLGAPGPIPRTNVPEWTLGRGRHFVAVALREHKAQNSNELSFGKNQIFFVKPESLQPGSKWLIACVASNPKTKPPNSIKIGLIPLNYVRLVMK